jgi:hypothetical protein
MKLCSVYVRGIWNLSDGATAGRCVIVEATHFHLMCVFTRRDPNDLHRRPGDLLEPNCGMGGRR